MRPTDLGFRSPRERTPGAKYYPESINPSTAKSFGKAERFNLYRSLLTRTDERIGPGTYSQHAKDYVLQKVCTPVFRLTYKRAGSVGHYFAGNHLVYDYSYVKALNKNAPHNDMYEGSTHTRTNSRSNN